MTPPSTGSWPRGPLPAALAWAGPGLGRVYGGIARWRRLRATRPGARRWLHQPVVSIGNLSVGGSGKTPLVAWLAAQLVAAGERPAILSRGYGRTASPDGVVVVRDIDRTRASLAEAGDEPLMLANMVHGCAVVVHPDRHLAGVLAESRLGCTVHLLDDGFQHLALGRDLDLVIVGAQDVDGAPVPAGWLREWPEAADVADAWIVHADERHAVAPPARDPALPVFVMARHVDRPRLHDRPGSDASVDTALPLLLMSGIATAGRFEADVRAHGYAIVDHVRFPDHHAYTRSDVARVHTRLREQAGAVVVTTEKDLVRLMPFAPLPFPLAVVPLRASIEPAEPFMDWLRDGLDAARRRARQRRPRA